MFRVRNELHSVFVSEPPNSHVPVHLGLPGPTLELLSELHADSLSFELVPAVQQLVGDGVSSVFRKQRNEQLESDLEQLFVPDRLLPDLGYD